MRVNRRLEELSGFHLGLLQYFLQKGLETSTKWKYISSQMHRKKLEVNEHAEVKVIPVAPRRPNRSSSSGSKGRCVCMEAFSFPPHPQRGSIYLPATSLVESRFSTCFSVLIQV